MMHVAGGVRCCCAWHTHAQTAGAVKPIPPMQPEQTAVPGRPEVPNAEVEKQLRNTPPLRFLLAEEKLPLGDLKVPMGFKVEG